MHARALSAVLALAPLMFAATGCDQQDDLDDVMLDEAQLEDRLGGITPIRKPYNGRWEGAMQSPSGDSDYDYDATIRLIPSLCSASGAEIATATWDYYNLGITCTSELELLGVSKDHNNIRTWTFSDTNLTGPCSAGLVDLTETDDPDVMEQTWRYPDGTVDAEGTADRTRTCGFSP